MKKCLIATHGRLASGFKSSLEILLGSTEGISVIDAYLDETNFEDHLIDYLNTQNNEDQIILMSDLYGGSVNQVMSRYANSSNRILVAGVNLAFVLEVVARGSSHISKEEIEFLVEESRKAIKIVKLEDVPLEDNFF